MYLNKNLVPKKAFSLLEVMVAISILSITLLGIYQSMGTSIFIISSTENLWKSMVYIQNELTRWERSNSSQVSVKQGEFEENHSMAGFSWVRTIEDVAPFPGVEVREVHYQLKWKERGQEYTYDSKIYIEPK